MTTDPDFPRDPHPSISTELDTALQTTPVLPRDALAVAMARRYATALDASLDALGADDATEDPAAHARVVLEVARLGQRLEAMLDRLGMAPSARPAVRGDGGESVDPASADLERLRADAAAGAPTTGVDYAAAVDPAVTEADTED